MRGKKRAAVWPLNRTLKLTLDVFASIDFKKGEKNVKEKAATL